VVVHVLHVRVRSSLLPLLLLWLLVVVVKLVLLQVESLELRWAAWCWY
jgi:hypothetical protein